MLSAQNAATEWSPEQQVELFGFCEKPYLIKQLKIAEANVDKIQITLKIALGGMNEIIQTFRRYNYEIISEHQEDNYLNNLKDRSEYLDKYLNM